MHVHIYIPGILMVSACCTIYTPGIRTYSSTVSSPLGRIQLICCKYSRSLQFEILSFHQVPITHGCKEAAWNKKFVWHFYTWPAMGIEPEIFWYLNPCNALSTWLNVPKFMGQTWFCIKPETVFQSHLLLFIRIRIICIIWQLVSDWLELVVGGYSIFIQEEPIGE